MLAPRYSIVGARAGRDAAASEVRMLVAVVAQRWNRATVHDLQDRVRIGRIAPLVGGRSGVD